MQGCSVPRLGPPGIEIHGITHIFALWGGLPSEASPSVPLHFVEREGPEISVIEFGNARSSAFPLSTKWRGGQGVRPRRADRASHPKMDESRYV